MISKNKYIYVQYLVIYNYKTKETSYYNRTREKLVGKAQSPWFLKKNFRLATRSLNPLNLLKLASKSKETQAILFKKPPKLKPTNTDFQEFLITNLLIF